MIRWLCLALLVLWATLRQLLFRLLAGMVYGLSGGRLLVGSSLSALARKPG